MNQNGWIDLIISEPKKDKSESSNSTSSAGNGASNISPNGDQQQQQTGSDQCQQQQKRHQQVQKPHRPTTLGVNRRQNAINLSGRLGFGERIKSDQIEDNLEG